MRKKKLAAFPPISMPKSSYALPKSSYAPLIFHNLVFHPAPRIDGFYLPTVSTRQTNGRQLRSGGGLQNVYVYLQDFLHTTITLQYQTREYGMDM